MDRDLVLRTAERLIRQGRLDRAIAEYVRLTEEQPNDFTSINALGDLYLKVGNADLALDQFVRVADHAFEEGFIPKAAALYRKALRVRATDEHTLLRLAEIAARQGLPGDARQYLQQVAGQRQQRGDDHGIAECVLRLGQLEDADPDARLAAARAAQTLANPGAVALLKSAAEALAQAGRGDEARAAFVDAAQLDTGDVRLRMRLARDAVAAREMERARPFLTRESAGDDPDLLLALGRMEIEDGREAEAFGAFTRLMAVAPDRQHELLELAGEIASAGAADLGYGCAEIVADAALLAGDWQRAADALLGFTERHPHASGLVKLAGVAEEAGLAEVRREAHLRLADLHLAEGRPAEARDLLEPLVEAWPDHDGARRALDRAFQLLGMDRPADVPPAAAPPADEPAAGDAFGEGPFTGGRSDDETFEPLDLLVDASFFADLESSAQEGPTGMPESALSLDLDALAAAFECLEPDGVPEVLEVDLSEAVGELRTAAGEEAVQAIAARTFDPEIRLESVFEEMREQAAAEQQFGAAQADYARGIEALAEGRLDTAAEALATAARAPLLRFPAAARLGHAYLDGGQPAEAVSWFERAAAAPPPTPEQGFEVLYGLADALERTGDGSRALAVLLELAAEAGPFRDVAARIDRLRGRDPEGGAA